MTSQQQWFTNSRKSDEIRIARSPQKKSIYLNTAISCFNNSFFSSQFPNQPDTMATTAKWTRFCGEDGKGHNANIIECPNSGATNPILHDHRPFRAKLERDIIGIDAIQPRRVRPSGITISTTGQRFQTYPRRKHRKATELHWVIQWHAFSGLRPFLFFLLWYHCGEPANHTASEYWYE